MKTPSALKVVIVSVLTLSGAVWAAETIMNVTESREAFRTLDTDGDGFVTNKEAVKMKGLSENFGAVDINSDGKLVLAELEVYLSQRNN